MIAGTLEIQLLANMARLQKDMDDAKTMVGGAMQKIERSVSAAKGALAGLFSGVGIRELGKLTDEYTKFTAQLRLASRGAAEYAQSYAEVKRIAKDAQSDLAATGTLYARIANSTRELGLAQTKVVDITESVSLALKASGATSAESASAMLQLSQAFAAGALRGEEFNAVNEAAPRLMKALADGIGVPVGALKEMASEGKITSAVMAEAIPLALQDLRKESAQVQTISGAFTVLKNSVMEFVGTQAQASGAVSAVTNGIGLLADNLNLVASAALGFAATKLAEILAGIGMKTGNAIASTVQYAAAQQASRAAAIGAAEAEVAKSAAQVATQRATIAAIEITRQEQVAKLQSAQASLAQADAMVAAATATGVMSGSLRILREAQFQATTATAAQAAAMAELALLGRQQAAVQLEVATATKANEAAQKSLAVAQGAAAATTGLATRALGLLGGPIGIVTTLLGLGVTAWTLWGSKAESASQQAANAAEGSLAALRESTKGILSELDKQISKYDRLLTAKGNATGMDAAQRYDNYYAEQLKWAQKLADMRAGTGEFAGKTLSREDRWTVEQEALKNIAAYTDKIRQAEEKRGQVETKTATERALDLRKEMKLKGEALKARLAEIDVLEKQGVDEKTIADLRMRAYETLGEKAKKEGKANADRKTAADQYIESLHEQLAAIHEQTNGSEKLSKAQQLLIKLDADLATGKDQSLRQREQEIRQGIAVIDLLEREVKARVEDKRFRDEQLNSSLQSVDQLEKQLEALRREGEQIGLTKEQTELLEVARLRDAAATKRQQLAEAEKTSDSASYIEGLRLEAELLEQIADQKQVNAGQQSLADQAKKAGDEWTKVADQIGQGLTDSLFRAFENGKDFGTTFLDGLKNLFKTTILRIPLQFIQQGISGLVQSGVSMLGLGGSSGGASSMLGMASGANSIYGALQAGAVSLPGFLATPIAEMAGGDVLGNLIALKGAGTGGATPGIAGLSSGLNFLGGTAAGYGVGSLISGNYAAIGNTQAWASGGGAAAGAAIGSIVPGLGTLIGGIIGGALGGVVNRAFGRGPKEVQSSGIEGRFTGAGFSGGQYVDYKQKGGWFRSDRYSSESKPFSDKEMDAIQTEFFGMVDILKGLNSVSNKWEMDSRLGMFDYSIRNDWRSEENRKKSWDDLSDALATTMVPGVEAFRKEGENLVQTALRLTDVFKSTNTVAEVLGKNLDTAFGIGGIGGAKKRQVMVDAAGGTENLTAITTAYMDAAFSDQEKVTYAAKQLGDQFAALGFSMPESTAQLREWIEQQDLSRENEAQHAVALMALTPAYKQLEDAMRGLNSTVVEARTGIADLENILLTDQQKQENRINSMRGELDKLGLSSITTREGLLEYARGLDRNSEAGEEAYQALVRVAPAFLEVEAAAAAAAAAAEEAAARTRELTSSYFSMFKSPAEQLGLLQDQLAGEFAKLGHALPMSAGAYTQLVDSIDTSTESGRKLKDGLMALAQQMSTFLQQMQAQGQHLGTGLSDIMAQQMVALESLRGRVASLSAEVQAAFTLRGNARSMLSQISGALGQTASTGGRKDQLWGMLGSGISPQQQLDIASELMGLITQTAAVDTTAAQELMSGAQASASAANAQLSAAKALEDAGRRLHDWVQSLKTGNLSPLTMGEKLAEAARQYQQTLAAAQGGDQSAIGNLQGAASAYLELARTYYASSDQYTTIFNQVTSAVEALGAGLMGQGSGQAAAAQAQLDAANKQIEVAQGQLDAAQKQTGLSQTQIDELTRLQAFVQGIESAADANYQDLTGKLASELSVLQAMEKALGLQSTVPGLLAGLPAELAAALQPLINTVSGGTKYANDLYQQYLGRPGEKAGVDYWARQLSEGTRTVGDFMWGAYEEQVRKAYTDIMGREADESGLRYYVQQMQAGRPIEEIRKDLEYGKLNGAYADGGFAPRGLALVGENGPEVVDFRSPGRVYTAGQLSDALTRYAAPDLSRFSSGDAAAAVFKDEIQRLRATVERLETTVQRVGDQDRKTQVSVGNHVASAAKEGTREAAQIAKARSVNLA